jgi:large subunit ribosomal protein L21
MEAVIETGGKQYRVREGMLIHVERLPGVQRIAAAGDAEGSRAAEEVVFDRVLAHGSGAGMTVGRPYVSGASVRAVVEGVGRERKVHILKMRRRKHYMKRQGHRQHYMAVRIVAIEQGQAAAAPESAP